MDQNSKLLLRKSSPHPLQCITLLLLILLRGILYVGLYCGRLSESPVGTLESFSEFGAHSFLKTFHCSSSYFSSVHRLRRDDDDGPFKCSLSRCWIIIMIVFSQLCNTPTEERNSSRERRIFQSIFRQFSFKDVKISTYLECVNQFVWLIAL